MIRTSRSILLFFVFLAKTVFPQVDETSVKTILLQKFADNIEWPKAAIEDSFCFGVYSFDTTLVGILRTSTEGKTMYKHPVSVRQITKVEQVPGCDVLYLPPEEAYKAERIWEELEGEHVLFITEGLSNLLFSMINIEYSSIQKRFSFVLNSSNLQIEGLKAKPDLLLAGGTEIDVRELYRQTKEQLDEEMGKVQMQRKLISLQLEKLGEQESQITEQTSRLEEQMKVIQLHESLIGSQKGTLEQLNNVIAKKEDSIVLNKGFIQKQQDIISRQRQSVVLKESELERLNSQLEYISQQIHQKQKILDQRQAQLEQKEAVISSQKLYLWLAAVGISFGVLILSFIYYAYRSKALANKALDDKNAMLEIHQNEIEKQANELRNMNRQLSNQKDELEDALHKLKEAQSQLVQSEKMASLGTLTAGIAHEINNPVNFITSGIEGLKSVIEPLDEILHEFASIQPGPDAEQMIIRSKELYQALGTDELVEGLKLMTHNIEIGAERASEIVKGLNNFSRSSEQKEVPIDLAESIESTLLIMHSEVKHRIKVQKFFDQIPAVSCLPGKINQVLLNILTNAAQAIVGEGVIKIATENAENGFVRVRISDDGPGIEPKNLDRIFEPFYTTKAPGKGTGLGLAISYSIIKQHGGSIDVKSELGKGTEFVIKLPVELKRVIDEV